MGTWRQLRLLLWKDYLIRRRNIGEHLLLFGWAIGVFLVLYSVRYTVEPYYQHTCHYKERGLPSNGLLPFVQSFICNIDNKCNSLPNYEQVPPYKDSKLTDTLNILQSVLNNETLQSTISHLPQMARLVSTIVNRVAEGGIQNLIGSGIKISDLFDDPLILKSSLKDHFSEENLKQILNAKIKFSEILNILNASSNNIDICDPKQMDLILILPDGTSVEEITKNICDIKPEKVPKLIQKVLKEANFESILKMVNNLMSNFQNYNLFDDLSNILSTFLNLESVDKILPKDLKLKEWLPKIITNLNFSKTFTIENFVNESLNDLEPYFNKKPKWDTVKKLFLHLITTNFTEGEYNKFVEEFESDINGSIDYRYSKIITNFFKLLFKSAHRKEDNLSQVLAFLDFIISMPTTEVGSKPIQKVWGALKNCTTEECQQLWLDRILSSIKYFSASLNLATNTVRTYFDTISQKDIDIFTLASFDQNSGPYRMFKKLPEILRVLVDTYRDVNFEEKLLKILKKRQTHMQRYF